MGVLLFEAFSLQKLVVSPFPSITNQLSVDNLGLDKKYCIISKNSQAFNIKLCD